MIVKDTNDPTRDIIANSVKESFGIDPDADESLDPIEGDADGGDAGDAGIEGDEPVLDGAAGDGADTGGDGQGDGEPVVEVPATDAGADKGAVVPDVAAKAAADADAAAGKAGAKVDEHDITKVAARDAQGRVNRIPHPRVVKMVEASVKKARTDWEAKELAPIRTKVAAQDKDLASFRGVEKILFDEPRRYVAMLMSTVPGYKALFEEMGLGKGFRAGKEETKPGVGTELAAGATDPNDPEPKPDAIENGKVVGWTEKGLADLRAWDRRQAVRESAKAANEQFEKRFGKVLSTTEKQQKDAAAAEETNRSIENAMTDAMTWPGFSENVTAISAELQKGTDLLDTYDKMNKALSAAYNTVMFGTVTKFRETEEQSKARHFEEFQKSVKRAPRNTGAVSTRARVEPEVEADGRSQDDRANDIIRESMRKSGLLK